MSIQAYQTSGSGTVAVPNSPILSPRSPTTTDIVSPAGNPYQLLQGWKNTTTGAVFEYAGGGIWVEVVDSGGGGPITTLTGNTGGAIAPIAGNVNILGNAQATFVGTAGTLTLTQTAAGFPITPFVVGAAGVAGYQTIQSAITAATATGGVVYIQPGTYTENLTLANGVYLVGTNDSPDAGLCRIVGVHVPPATGSCTFSNLYLQSTTHVFSSAVAGSATLSLTNCTVNLTNGYIFNLANWTGPLLLDRINDVSTINGVVTNAGGSSIFFALSDIGVGTANSMSTTGTVVLQTVNLRCPWSLATGTVADIISCEFLRTVTCANNSTANFQNSVFSTGATAALTMSSSGSVRITESSINSSNNPVISGAGAGTLSLGNITYILGKNIASTVIFSYLPAIARISPFVVGASGNYSTIQSAITAASAAGGGCVYLQPGTYTENLTLAANVDIIGTSASSDGSLCTIVGVHVPPPGAGAVAFINLSLQSTTHIFSSAVAGTAILSLNICTVNLTNGYIFNLANWTGTLLLDQVNDLSTINGVVTNAGGSAVFFALSDIGVGTANSMSTTGSVVLQGVNLRCPWSLATGTVADCIASEFIRTVTCANNSVANFRNSSFSTGATAALTQSSSGAVALLNCSVTSSNVPAIAGAGAGILTLGGVDFTSNTTTAGTLTLGTADFFKAASFQWLSTGTATGNSPQIVNARSGRVVFQTVSIAAAADQTFVLTNSFILASTTNVMLNMSGATTGSALSIKSITNAAGSSTIVVTNGTGATTSTADITFDFVIIN